MSGKTLTRADLAEAVFQKVGLPRNEFGRDRGACASRNRGKLGARADREAVLVRLVRYSRQGSADRTQPKDRSGSSYYAAASSRIPGEQHHEAAYQRHAVSEKGGRIDVE